MSKLVFGVGSNDTTDGINIQIYNNDNLVGSCYMVAYSFKEKIGRLVLRENIELNFKDINLKILIIGVVLVKGLNIKQLKV